MRVNSKEATGSETLSEKQGFVFRNEDLEEAAALLLINQMMLSRLESSRITQVEDVHFTHSAAELKEKMTFRRTGSAVC